MLKLLTAAAPCEVHLVILQKCPDLALMPLAGSIDMVDVNDCSSAF